MGVYAQFADVANRYEGELPEDRRTWVELRIDDVEAELFGFVAALAEDVSTTDPPRAARVRRLVCEKVLALYRNPDGAVAVSSSSTMGSFAEASSRTLAGVATGAWFSFTDDELIRVGYVKATSVKLRARHYDERRGCPPWV